jgi:hypothetical protein
LTGHECGADFKSNLTNGSRNVPGEHGNKKGFSHKKLTKVVNYKKIILGRFHTLSTFFLTPTRIKICTKITHRHRFPQCLISPLAFFLFNFGASSFAQFFLTLF